MKIITKRIKPIDLTIGVKETRTFFAFLPIKANNEIRWFEKVTIEYNCYKSIVKHNIKKPNHPIIKRFWKPIKFINK